jgi:type I restriction enzyme S subunit
MSAEFVCYYLQSPEGRERLGVHTGGSVQQVINLRELRTVLVPKPPLPEQRRIVGILDEAFAGIARAVAATEKNLANARELFETQLNAIFSTTSDGRERVFSDICEILSPLVDPRLPQYLHLHHVGGANIETKTGKLIELKTAEEEGLISGKFAFDPTMVLYSKIRPYLMKVCRPSFEGLCSADIYPLSPKKGELDRNYLYYMLLSPRFTEYAISGSARAGMPKVNRDHLFAYRVTVPSFEFQARSAKRLDELREETQTLESLYRRKLAALAELRQALLQKAFAGELTKGDPAEAVA